MKEIKVMGTVDETGTLSLDAPLPLKKTSRVEVIILVPESELEDELPTALGKPESLIAKEPFIPIKKEATNDTPSLRDIAFDPNATPIWELAAQITASIPAEEWAKLPSDLAQNFDHYQNVSLVMQKTF